MSWVNTSPAVVDGVVYAGSSDERFLQAVDARTGRELWRVTTERPVWSSPAVAGGMVYVGDGSGTVYAVDRASGKERWRHRAGRRIFSSPVLGDGLLYVGNDDGGIYALRTGTAPLRRAVFWDSSLVRASRVATHVELRDYLAERGYEVLDAQGIARFMSRRLADRSPSVVVVSIDHLPATVAPVAADTVLFRRYLDAGGKVVWPGIPPMIWPRDPKTGEGTEYIQIDRAGTSRLLGVDHARSNFDNYGAVVTSEGLRWGLSGWWDSNWSVDPAGVTETLALDDNGLASSWVKRYGGPPGTGFVRVYGGTWSGGRAHSEPCGGAGSGGTSAPIGSLPSAVPPSGPLPRPVERRIARPGSEVGRSPPVPAPPELEVFLVQDPAGERRGSLLLDLPEQHLGPHFSGRFP